MEAPQVIFFSPVGNSGTKQHPLEGSDSQANIFVQLPGFEPTPAGPSLVFSLML